MPLIIGEILNERYRVDKLIGQGGFGAVYQAYDLTLQQTCAIKENLNAEPEAQRQFEHEALILARLRHPNLPRVIDHFSRSGQSQYLVMDFVEGHSLYHLLRIQTRPLSEEAALAWIDQVCQALIYLHRQEPPIIHRDIKPQNIIITPAGRAMLVDFGLSKLYDEQLKTTTGARGVTFGYAPPEQYGQGRTDVRSDIYALGATLYTMLTSQRPPDAIERLVNAAPLMPLRHYCPHLSPHVEQAVLKAMELTTSSRFASVEIFHRALTGPRFFMLKRSQQPTQPSEPARLKPEGQPLPAKGRWLSPLWLGVIVMSLVIFAGLTTTGLAWLYQGNPESALASVPTPTAAKAAIVEYQLIPSLTPTATAQPSPTSTATRPLPADTPPPTDTPTPADLPPTDTPFPPTPTPLPPTATFTPTPTPLLSSPFLFAENNNLVRMNVDGSTETLANLGLDIPPFSTISLSPNQRQITLNIYGGGEGSELYMSNLDGTGLIHVTEADASYTFGSSWSLDGTRLALISGPKARYSRLYVVNADGSNRQQIGLETIEFPPQDPIWLSDGQHILFTGVMQGFWELFLIQPDGANLTCLTCAMGADVTTPHEHIVSGNGQQFVYQSGNDIYVRDVAGGEPRKLTADLDKDVGSPTWSPDEQRIVFGAFEVNSDYSEYSLYVVNPDGSNLSELPIPTWDIVWSPDGQKFAFSFFGGLFVGNLDGTQPLKLVPESFSTDEFDWSPDGQQLIFPSRGEVPSNETDASDDYFKVDFYVVQADGSWLTRLTQTLSQKTFIGWLPDEGRE